MKVSEFPRLAGLDDEANPPPPPGKVRILDPEAGVYVVELWTDDVYAAMAPRDRPAGAVHCAAAKVWSRLGFTLPFAD